MQFTLQDQTFMQRALEIARHGEGRVEPNPMVGCVIVQDGTVVGEGFHAAFGQAHAEANAIANAGDAALGATMYVTLEPCCHQGKTPPCTEAIVAAQIARVVVACNDPFPQVNGGGIAALRAAGVEVETGMLQPAAETLIAPYRRCVETGRPWVIAKWAMTMDGKIATSSGNSRWISGEGARRIVHQIRGRMDGIMVGRGTALADDPLLTARPPGPRTATRIVLDSQATLPLDSQLVKTARDVPVLIVTSAQAPSASIEKLTVAGCEVLALDEAPRDDRLIALLNELGKRDMTNLLVEGGGQLLGSFFDAGLIDEVHAFIAPILAGGAGPSALLGQGILQMTDAAQLQDARIEVIGKDAYIQGRIWRSHG